LSARFHKMEILSAPAQGSAEIFLCDPSFSSCLHFFQKMEVKIYLTTKFAASQLLPKIPISGKNESDIVESAAVLKIPNIRKFWKRGI